MKIQIYFPCLLILIVSLSWGQQNNFSVLKGPYLGQKPPGMTPKVFAPSIISTNDDEGCSGFLNDGKLFIFNRSAHGDTNWTYIPIYQMEMKDGKWTKPYPVPFQKGHNDDNFTVAPDGKTIYFQSDRSIDGSGQSTRHSFIWKVTKTVEDWSEPRMLNPALMGGYPSVTNECTVYLSSSVRKGFGKVDIYSSILKDGKYSKAQNIGKVINTENIELDSFIAPNKSYLIYCSDKPGGYGKYDLYIAFQKRDGSWTEPINMGKEINSSLSVTRPSVTPDGKYFFFCKHFSNRDDIFWVDAKIIDTLKPEEIE